jgi:hypothetical protein
MTDLTAREILDAIRRGTEETWRQMHEKYGAETRRKSQQGQAPDYAVANDNAAKPRPD